MSRIYSFQCCQIGIFPLILEDFLLYRRKSERQKYLEGNLGFFQDEILGVQLCFRRFPINGFSGKW